MQLKQAKAWWSKTRSLQGAWLSAEWEWSNDYYSGSEQICDIYEDMMLILDQPYIFGQEEIVVNQQSKDKRFFFFLSILGQDNSQNKDEFTQGAKLQLLCKS